MLGVRIFLGLSALVWLPYGILCFAAPEFLNGAAGVSAASATGSTELRAMYGGLEAAIGVLVLLGAMRDSLARPALVVLAFLCGGLALGRLGGVWIDGAISAYTASALALEIASALLAVHFLTRAPAAPSV